MALPRAIVFDMDGTLTDTEQAWDDVRRGLAAADGVPWPPTATTDQMGMSTPEWSAYLVDTVGLHGTAEEAARRTIEGMAELYRSGRVSLLPGAVDAVRRMAAMAPLAVASSSPPILIEAGLTQMGVMDLVGVRVSTEEVPRGKPAPDGYLEACRRLGVSPTEAVAVEDSSNGIRSAHAAGMKVVAVPPDFHPPAADVLALADAVVDDLAGLTPELVRSMFS